MLRGAWPGAAVVIGAVSLLAASIHGPARAAELAALTSEPLPLAIRDGRVARLSVHAVPFEVGSSDLQPSAAEALDALVAGIATDCFLTAQAIGHVRPGTPGEGDTLAAHRLARARSEAVQAALVRGGLPAASVASVWDYQFTTREPRVTLWVFSLPAGDDCKGTPLPGAPARVAAAQPPPATAAAAAVPVRPAERSLEPAPGIHLAAPPPTVTVAATEPQAPPAADHESSPPPVGQAEVVPSPQVTNDPAPAPAPSTVAMTPVPATGAPVATAEIVFDPNSSYFPRGAEAELQRLVEALPAAPGYEFEVQAAVDDTVYRVADPAKAVAYNAWLADRRQGRVADWLEQHAELRVVEFRRAMLQHDPSRRVVVSARPLPAKVASGG